MSKDLPLALHDLIKASKDYLNEQQEEAKDNWCMALKYGDCKSRSCLIRNGILHPYPMCKALALSDVIDNALKELDDLG